MFCSVVKHLGSGRALKKWGKTLDCVSCFPLHFFRALPLPAFFTTEQNKVEASLFVKLNGQSEAPACIFCIFGIFKCATLVLTVKQCRAIILRSDVNLNDASVCMDIN